MTAAIAEVPKVKAPAATPLHAMAPTLYAPSPSTVYEIPVDLIVRSETNRQPELDDDFVESISRGVDTPVLVRPIKATQKDIDSFFEQWHEITLDPVKVGQTIYKLVYGERRWAAAKKAGNKTIPAIVRELTETQALEIQVRENEQRKDYNIMDRAAAYAHLRAQYMKDHHGEKGFTEEKCMDLIAQTCKNDKIKGRTVQQIIALGKLSRECQEALRKGEMEQSHAYEFSRLSAQDQAELLLWLRQQTHHSQGDIPSVRRLKLEIRNMEQQREAEKRRQPLFAPPQPGTSTTRVPTVAEVALPGSKSIMKEYQKEKASAQTSAADRKTEKAILAYKPPTEAQLKRQEQERQKEQERFHKQRAADLRNSRIEKQYSVLLFVALAKKAHVCSRLLSHIIPGMLFEMWEQGGSAILLEAFAPEVMGWPKPRDGEYSYAEVKEYSERHTRKFTGNLLSALLITQQLGTPKAEQLAKYFSIDPKRLRQKATAAIKEEDAAAKLKAKGQKPKAGVRA